MSDTFDQDDEDGFGGAKLGPDGWNRYKLKANKDGSESVLDARLFPSYGAFRSLDKWCDYQTQHFGFNGKNTEDESKQRMRPFLCVCEEDYRTRKIKVECPMCTLIAQRKEEREAKMTKLMAQGKSKEEALILTKDLGEWLKDYNADRKWVMAVMATDGGVGILSITHTCKKKLEALLRKLKRDEDIDALSLTDGVWLRFTRTGTGFQVEDDVDVIYDNVTSDDGKKYKQIRMAPVTAEQARHALKVLPPLSEVNTRITRDQVARLVACSGDPEEVDAIFDEGKEARPSNDERAEVVVKAAIAAPKVAPKAVEKEVPAPEEDEEAVLMRKLAATRAAKAAAAAALTVPAAPEVKKVDVKAPPKVVSPDEIDGMSTEDFLSNYIDPAQA